MIFYCFGACFNFLHPIRLHYFLCIVFDWLACNLLVLYNNHMSMIWFKREGFKVILFVQFIIFIRPNRINSILYVFVVLCHSGAFYAYFLSSIKQPLYFSIIWSTNWSIKWHLSYYFVWFCQVTIFSSYGYL